MVNDWIKEINTTNSGKRLKDNILSSPFKNYSTVIIEHAFASQGIRTKQKVGTNDQLVCDVDKLVGELRYMLNLFDTDPDTDTRRSNFILGEIGYFPYMYLHLPLGENEIKYFDTFDLTVREFYTMNRGETQTRANKVIADKKVVKKDKKKNAEKKEEIISSIKTRIDDMQTKKDNIASIIECCETNSVYIETVLTHCMDMSKQRIDPHMIITKFNNPSKSSKSSESRGLIKIKSINLADKTVTFEASELEFVLNWTIGLNKSIREIYNNSKSIGSKMTKTLSVMQDIEKKTIKERKENEKSEKTINVNIKRKQLWFEKYNWFLSSDDMMVVSGKDAKSNEYLVKNMMQEYDLYVHSDQPGSGSCLILNPLKLPLDSIPNRTKEEAGMFVVAHTKAWESNVPDKAYWVVADQVSKTPETGEYITTGSFIVRGKRNYMTPVTFIMGLCVLFWNGNTLTRSSDHCTKFAIVSCAPYTATSNCVYRKKTLPGTGKLNRTIETVINMFCNPSKTQDKIKTSKILKHQDNINDPHSTSETMDENNEKNEDVIPDKIYIKNIPLNDWHAVCPGRIKIV